MTEGEWHRNVRLDRIEKYQKEGFEVKYSHGSRDLPLFRGEPSNITHLSDATITLLK